VRNFQATNIITDLTVTVAMNDYETEVAELNRRGQYRTEQGRTERMGQKRAGQKEGQSRTYLSSHLLDGDRNNTTEFIKS